jgi:hypothetical protein
MERRTKYLQAAQNPPPSCPLASPDQGAELAQAIIDGDAIAVSDGSFKEDYGTAGWTLRGQDDDIFMTGVNVTPGKSSTQSAFRSELSGLYGVGFHQKFARSSDRQYVNRPQSAGHYFSKKDTLLNLGRKHTADSQEMTLLPTRRNHGAPPL